jgi:hypothetical protein
MAAGNEYEPLWLHLVKPYGYLGALPWEAALREVTDRPIFRLPDFLEPPRENSNVLEVALLWDIPFEAHFGSLLADTVQSWLDAPARRHIRLHVFANDREAVATLPESSHLSVHAMESLSSSLVGGPVRLLEWVHSTVSPAALDAVHIFARATFDFERSFLQFSPEQPEQAVTFISPAEIGSFLNRVGAWSFVLSGPPDRSAGAALRHFADSVAQFRPGPSIYHPLRDEVIRNELRPVLHVLFSSADQERPIVTESFVYCQPALVCDRIRVAEQPTIPGADQNDDLLSVGWQDEEAQQAPDWVASVQRVVEQFGLECARDVSGDALLRNLLSEAPRLASDLQDSRDNNVVQQTLDDLQSIIRRATSYVSHPGLGGRKK